MFYKYLRCLLASALLMTKIITLYSQSLYVGESAWLNPPSVYGVLDAAAWYCDNGQNLVSVSGGTNGASVSPINYFTGSAIVVCQYAYHTYIGTSRYNYTGKISYSITCRPSTVTLDHSELTIAPGQSIEIGFVNSSGFQNIGSSWVIDDKNIAYFENTGNGEVNHLQKVTIIGKSPGKCKVTCNTNTGSNPATCILTVKEIPPTSMTVSPIQLFLLEKETRYLDVQLFPEGAYSTITWGSSNESVAKVSSSGRVEAISSGVATITAITKNGISATSHVTVSPQPESVELDDKNVTIGYYLSLKPILYPRNAITTYKWSTNDKNVVSLDKNGLIKALAKGVATINVTTTNGKTASCRVTVVEPPVQMDYRNANVRVKALNKLFSFSKNNLKK